MTSLPSEPFAAGAAPGSLSGQVVILFGADQALVRLLAQALTHLSAQVVVAAPVPHDADPQAQGQAGGGLARYFHGDPDDEASLAALAEQVAGTFGPADVVVSVAADAGRAPFLELSAADWDQQVTRPLRRAWALGQAFLPAMLTRGRGTMLHLAYDAPGTQRAAAATAQNGLIGLSQALAAEAQTRGVRVLALTAAHDTPREQSAGAVAYLLSRPVHELASSVSDVEAVLEQAGYSHAAGGHADTPTTAADLTQAMELAQQLAALLMDTDSDFDRLPIGLRPMARGAFMSKVGYRSQDVLRAVSRLGDQLQRMQANHSRTDTEFQVDFLRLGELLERLSTYYHSLTSDTAALTTDQVLLSQLRRQMSERAALIQNLLAILRRLHST